MEHEHREEPAKAPAAEAAQRPAGGEFATLVGIMLTVLAITIVIQQLK